MRRGRALLVVMTAVALTAAPRPGAAQDNPFADAAAPASPSPAPPALDIVCAPWDARCQAQDTGSGGSGGGGSGGLDLVARGSAVCWGGGAAAAAADQQQDGAAPAPGGGVRPVPTSLQFTQLSASNAFVCGLTTRATIACFGSSTPMDDSDLDYQPPTETRFASSSSSGTGGAAAGAVNAASAPAPAPAQGQALTGAASAGGDDAKAEAAGLGQKFSQVVTGHAFACGLLLNGSVACFGHLPGEALWTGPPAADEVITPTLVGRPELQWTSLAAGGDRACGVLANGSLACFWAPWAADPHPYCGNLADAGGPAGLEEGFGGNLTDPSPALLGDPSLAFAGVAVGEGLVCGLLAPNRSAVCMCGYADAAASQALPAEPRLMFGGSGGFQAVAARGGTVCAITEAGALQCSGIISSSLDPNGYPELVFSALPAVIDASRNYTTVSVGGSGLAFHACGLTAAGEALCWGLNSELQLGSAAGGANSSATPLPVDSPLQFSNVAAGGDFSCAVVA